MPAQPSWFQRLESILAELRRLDMACLDRQAVEKLFRVKQRRARQLMAGLPSIQVGNAVAVDRMALIARLENTAAGEAFRWEMSRRSRLAERIDSLRKHATAARVRLRAGSEARDRTLVGTLGESIELAGGELRIRFAGAEDLAAKLFELSQAMVNDWEAFQMNVEGRQVK
jgi:hypothetical protein